MKIIDTFFLMVVALTIPMSLFLGYTYVAVFITLLFVIFLTNIVIHYLTLPLPRYIMGAVAVSKDEIEKLKRIEEEE
jgi:hypothetical protein